MKEYIPGLIFGLFFSGCGFLLVYGAYKKWKFLVDPPTGLWPFYTQSLIKKIDGSEGARGYALFIGTLILCFGLYGSFLSLKHIIRLSGVF